MRIGDVSAYWQKPTVGPVVQVDDPAAVEVVRRLYPYDRPVFTKSWQAMAGLDIVQDAPALLVAAIVFGPMIYNLVRGAVK